MSSFNFDENTINKLKNMMDNGELNDVISQIPPEMIQNFSSMMNSNQNNSNNTSNIKNSHSNSNSNNTSTHSYATDSTSHNTSSNANSNSTNFDFSNIDMNTMVKIKSIFDNMNNKNDPRTNLLNSLKPYLRQSRKEKIDQYANLLNFANIAKFMNSDNSHQQSDISSNKNKETNNTHQMEKSND